MTLDSFPASIVYIFDNADSSSVLADNVTYAQFADQTVAIGPISLTGTAGNETLTGGGSPTTR